MKKFIIEYLNIIGYAVAGLVFAYSAFYLLINVYHQKELNRKNTIDVTEGSSYAMIVSKVNQVSENITGFDTSKYKGSVPVHYLLNIQGRLEICTRQFFNESFTSLREKKEVGIQDVEILRQSFQNEVLSSCLVEQLYDLSVTNQTNRFPIDSLKSIAPYVELNIKNLLASNNYLTSDIQNNNVYYFTTEHTNTNFLNKVSMGYSEVIASYNRAADLLVQLSSWFKEEVNR